MALIRGHHSFDDHFTQIPNDWVRDERLSLEARGLLAQIMSHRPGWNLSIKSLAARNSIGRDKVKRILDELLTHGYLERSEKQTHDERGHLSGFDYTTRDPQGVTQEPYKAEPAKADRPPKNTIPKEKQDSKKAMTADDYQPSEGLLEELRGKHAHVSLDVELEKFRDHHMARGSRFSIWDRAFRKWISQAAEWSQPKSGIVSQKPTPGPGRREWARAEHERGDHWACRPGEFGCK